MRPEPPRPEISLELTDLSGVDDPWRAERGEAFANGRGEGPFLADAHRIKQRRIGPAPASGETARLGQ
jgi:hypothetical protein